MQRSTLEPNSIVQAALDLLDQVGLDELSTRRLAKALGVKSAALYWHIRDKQELLDRMAQALLVQGLATAQTTRKEPEAGIKKLEWFAHGLRDALCSRKDGARLVTAANVSDPNDPLLKNMAAIVTTLVAEGYTVEDALGGVLTIIHYTIGATLEEQSDPRGGDPVLPPELPAALLPLLAKIPDKGDQSVVSARFEMGVRLILDGLQARYQKP